MDVVGWLRGLGLERYEQAFRDNDIGADLLARLTAEDLKEIGVALVGHRRRLLDAIAELRAAAQPPADPPREALEPAVRGPRAEAPVSAERRQLTVMFVDLVGSTGLAQGLDPEDLRATIRSYHEACAGVVARFGGVVAKYLGDGVLAYFGWPRTREDEPQRAVQAGLAIVETVARLGAAGVEPLAVRIGIATGLVVVGDILGDGAAREEAVVGETPNLAARLQQLAEPGAVVVAEDTKRLLDGLFAVEDLGVQSVRGFAGPLRAWRVLGERTIDSRFAARATRLMPLAGRERELALLLDCWQQAREGEGQVVLLLGEPGIGKSRIVHALCQHLAGRRHLRLQFQCSPHYVDSALHPMIEHLERAGSFGRDEPPAAKLVKLEALLGRGTDRASQVAPLIAALLSIPSAGRYPPLTAAPQRQREATIDVLVEHVAGLACRQPVLAVFEDLHWADPTTLELLDRLIERIADERVLLLLTSRPDIPPPWKGRLRATRISLNRLPRRQSAALATAVAGEHGLPDTVLQQIVARADGVPLFIEELTKTVLETADDTTAPHGGGDRRRSAGTAPRPTIPATLQDSLMARLDRLGRAKELAQIGATIGREFGYELLTAVSPRAESDLRDGLDLLVASELVFVRGTLPATTYTFKHALVQDVAYASLLKSRRQQLHARIAGALEERWPETRQVRPELLAHHFAEAGMPQQAAAYGLEAGKSSFGRSAAAEAVAHLHRALDLLSRLPEDESRRRLQLDLQITLGHALIAAKGYGVPGVAEAFDRARQLVGSADPTQRIAVLSGIGAYHYLRSESRAALRVGRDIVRLGRRGANPTVYIEGQRRVGGALQQLGRLVPAQRHFEKGLARFASPQEPVSEPTYIVEPHATLLSLLSANLLLLGYPDQARARRGEAIELTRRAAHPLTLASTMHWAALSAFLLQDRTALRGWVEEFVAVTAEHTLAHFMQWAQIWRRWLAIEDGDSRESLPRLREALSVHWASGTRFWSPMYTALLADAYRRVGETDRAVEALADALDQVEQTGQRVYEPELHRLKGAVLLAQAPSATDRAEACLLQALAIAREQAARLWELRAATDLARLWQAQDRMHEARHLLEPIYSWFTEGFDTPDLKQAAALLEELR